jgi:hypothetical protein
MERFFDTLYLRYEERFVYSAPDLKHITRRLEWSAASPALTEPRVDLDFEPRFDGDAAQSPRSDRKRRRPRED